MAKFKVKFHSMKVKMIAYVTVMLIISMAAITSVFAVNSYKSTMNLSEDSLTEITHVAADKIKVQIQSYQNTIVFYADEAEITSDKPEADVVKYLDEVAQKFGFGYVRRTNKDGIAYESKSDVSDREYFNACKSGAKSYVSDTLAAKDTGKRYFMVASPIMLNGSFDGVLYAAIPIEELTSMVSQVSVGNSGIAYILDKTGTTIAFPDYKIVENKQNIKEQAKTDKNLEQLSKIEMQMAEGKTGFDEYSYNSENKLMAFIPIDSTQGWSLGVVINKEEYFRSTYEAIFYCCIVALFMIGLSIILFTLYAHKMGKAINGVEKASKEMAQGNLNVNIAVNRKDEIGRLAESFNETAERLQSYISDIQINSNLMAKGNFNVIFENEFVGDFASIQDAITDLSTSLSNTLGQVREAASQVESGGNQVSSGAQALSQGATEQASSIEELSAVISEISGQVKQTAVNANEANTTVGAVASELNLSNEKMTELMHAMENISHASREIGKIIKAIDDIAFQTNILALNAAVEAARAGAAGKGFAVVAEEVRNLATKSAEAAKTTTNLIEESVVAVDGGLSLANTTAESLNSVVAGAQSVASLISQISEAANIQATSISQITQGVEQISGVVQTNSATAEESAAASEELSSQAELLNALVSQFTLQESQDIVDQVVCMQNTIQETESISQKNFNGDHSKY